MIYPSDRINRITEVLDSFLDDIRKLDDITMIDKAVGDRVQFLNIEFNLLKGEIGGIDGKETTKE